MDIIPSLISDADIMYMPDSLLIAFSKVFDDILAGKFAEYMKHPDSNPVVVGRLETIIGDSIKSHTFHNEVINSGARDIIMNISVETLAYKPMDYSLLLNTLTWAKKHRPYMRATIDPRSRSNYQSLEKEAGLFDAKATLEGYPLVYPHLCERSKANKKLFYSPNEKSKGTRIGALVRKAQDCDIALLGVQYVQYCNENNVSGWRASEF